MFDDVGTTMPSNAFSYVYTRSMRECARVSKDTVTWMESYT